MAGRVVVAFCGLIAIALPQARAQVDAGVPDAQPEPEPARARVDWSKAPRPDQASGVDVPPDGTGDGWRWAPRIALFVPKIALIVVASPLRLAAWSYDRYQFKDRFKQVFFNVDGTFGIYPVALFETTFGLNVGVRVVHKDLFGDRESVKLRAAFGGEFEQVYEAKTASGHRFGDRFSLQLEARYERRPRDLFYGIGNGDGGTPGGMLDPLTDPTSVRSKYRQDVARFVLRSEVDLGGPFSVLPSGAMVFRDFGVVDTMDENISENYDSTRLTGFDDGVSSLYGEIELRVDTRRRANEFESAAVDATGFLLSGFGGWQQGLGDTGGSFVRYGADVQHFLPIYGGNRILATRVFFEAVGGAGSELQDVPFVDLPRLGGPRLLRGYTTDRFRDRVVGFGSVEYIWDLGMFASAALFVDVGRPFSDWDTVELSNLRYGYGAAIQIHTKASFLGRFHVARNRDGGVFFNFAFDPLYGRRERAGRL